jgi:hypothetical protein
MKYLGILENRAGEWVVNHSRAIEILGIEIAQDFVHINMSSIPLSPMQWIKEWQPSTQDEIGFIVVSDLVNQWAKQMDVSATQAESEVDSWMREQIYYGRIRITEMHTGQPRLGRGLYGDDNARKIKFEIIEL